MLEMLASGVTDVKAIASKAQMRLKQKISQLEEALNGFMGEHQKLMLKLMLNHIDSLDSQIKTLDQEIEHRLLPIQAKVDLIDSIPDIAKHSAQVIISQIGIDMNQFPTAAHVASWAGLCPGNNESAGKRKNGVTYPSNDEPESKSVYPIPPEPTYEPSLFKLSKLLLSK